MKNLIGYLEMVGQASGEKILEYMGDEWDTSEIFDLVDKGKVSSIQGAHGTRYFRYPAIGPDKDEDLTSELLAFLTKNSGLAGQEIQDALKWSKDKFTRRMNILLKSGEAVRVREGPAWIYRLVKVKKLVQSSSSPVGLGKPAVPDALGEGRDGRFKFERYERELSELDQRILAELEKFPDDRVVTHLAEDLGQKDERAFRKTLAKLHRDGYIGKVVEGEDTLWCSLKQV